MGYLEAVKQCRFQIKHFIKEKNGKEAAKYCRAYASVLEKMSKEVNSYKKAAYLQRNARSFYQLADYIESHGVDTRVTQVNIDADDFIFSKDIKSEPTPKTTEPSPKKSEPTPKKASPVPADVGAKESDAPPKKTRKAKDPVASNIKDGDAEGSSVSIPVNLPPAPKKDEPIPEKPTEPAKTNISEPMASVTADNGDDWSADLFEKYISATAVVTTSVSAGTGFFISPKGYFLTNHHVIVHGNVRESYIRLSTGDNKYHSNVTFIAADKNKDVALLKVNEKDTVFPFIPLIEDYSEVRAGASMMIIGNGLGFGLAPTTGNIKFTNHNNKDNLMYTAPSNSGDSGSPILNKNGFCIGIHKARESSEGSRGIALGTPADAIRKLLEQWKKQYDLDI